MYYHHHQLMFFFAGQLAHAQTFDRGVARRCMPWIYVVLLSTCSIAVVDQINYFLLFFAKRHNHDLILYFLSPVQTHEKKTVQTSLISNSIVWHGYIKCGGFLHVIFKKYKTFSVLIYSYTQFFVFPIFTSVDITVYQYGKNVLYFFYNIAQRTLTDEWREIFRVDIELYQHGS